MPRELPSGISDEHRVVLEQFLCGWLSAGELSRRLSLADGSRAPAAEVEAPGPVEAERPVIATPVAASSGRHRLRTVLPAFVRPSRPNVRADPHGQPLA